MIAQELLDRAKSAGLTVVTDGDRLRIRGPRESGELAQLLIQRKAEIIPILTRSPSGGNSECGDGDETSPFSDETGVSSPPVNRDQCSEPLTPDQIRFWLDCLRETGCQIALVDGAPWIRWSAGIATPGRLRDWQANMDTISAVLEAEEERAAIQEESSGDSEQNARSLTMTSQEIGSMGLKHEAKKPEIEQRGLRCRQCGGQRFRVVYTRAAWGSKVVRRRECRSCGERVTTWERAIGGG